MHLRHKLKANQHRMSRLYQIRCFLDVPLLSAQSTEHRQGELRSEGRLSVRTLAASELCKAMSGSCCRHICLLSQCAQCAMIKTQEPILQDKHTLPEPRGRFKLQAMPMFVNHLHIHTASTATSQRRGLVHGVWGKAWM